VQHRQSTERIEDPVVLQQFARIEVGTFEDAAAQDEDDDAHREREQAGDEPEGENPGHDRAGEVLVIAPVLLARDEGRRDRDDGAQPRERSAPASEQASWLTPSIRQPSPRKTWLWWSTKVWPGRLKGSASSFSASAMPTALVSPWPSEPVVVSTPGVASTSG
jgi:hypothetical protein